VGAAAAPNAPPEEASDFERRFREYVLPSDRRHSALITALTVPPGVIFIVADYRLYGLEATFWAYAGVRLVFGLLGISGTPSSAPETNTTRESSQAAP
jgi:hypothetical protein